jgi:hypothetical protein
MEGRICQQATLHCDFDFREVVDNLTPHDLDCFGFAPQLRHRPHYHHRTMGYHLAVRCCFPVWSLGFVALHRSQTPLPQSSMYNDVQELLSVAYSALRHLSGLAWGYSTL